MNDRVRQLHYQIARDILGWDFEDHPDGLVPIKGLMPNSKRYVDIPNFTAETEWKDILVAIFRTKGWHIEPRGEFYAFYIESDIMLIIDATFRPKLLDMYRVKKNQLIPFMLLLAQNKYKALDGLSDRELAEYLSIPEEMLTLPLGI